jgi:hypothetical protein
MGDGRGGAGVGVGMCVYMRLWLGLCGQWTVSHVQIVVSRQRIVVTRCLSHVGAGQVCIPNAQKYYTPETSAAPRSTQRP